MALAELHLPDNVKVHFAGCEVQNQYIAAEHLGIRYGLYTCFPFVERMVFEKAKAPVMPLRWQTNPAVDIPCTIYKQMCHTIQDSGLFTLMFGSRKGMNNESMINRWYDGMVEFTLHHKAPVTCVELDCQKILGVEKAWEFRERLARDIPNRIINVFHLEDGMKGLDRLIEYSNYIAISVPELRFAGKKDYVPALVGYIKKRKPSIDIHLLGCTELELLRKCKNTTSSDSTTWVSGKRFGFIAGKHISTIKSDKVKEICSEDIYNEVLSYNKKHYNTNFLILSVESLKKKYLQYAGNQDYYKVPHHEKDE